MANTYEGDSRPESEFDPFQNVKASNFDAATPAQQRSDQTHHHDHQQQQRPQQKLHPFSRDFIDSMFTVVDKDLLFCKLFYFFFFGAFGSLFPLLAIYFKQLGMNASQSGVLIGFRPFVEFLSAPFWGGLADKWRRGKEMLLFSLLCWIVFTLAIAFVQPPAHKCLVKKGNHKILDVPLGRRRRDVLLPATITTPADDDVGQLGIFDFDQPLKDDEDNNILDPTIDRTSSNFASPGIAAAVSAASLTLTANRSGAYISETFAKMQHPVVVLPEAVASYYYHTHHHRDKRSPYKVDASEIANANTSDLQGLIFTPHSTVVYREDEVRHVFFILLLIVIVGEFFSAPAITFADSVTLSFLGEDTQNYGRQRMFGSLGWGLAMFFVGMALDHSTTFPDHPCGKTHQAEKNYTVCFAVFSVLMSCAFLAALQFRFDHHSRDLRLAEIPQKVKEKVKRVISGTKKIDRERLVEEEDDDDFYNANRGGGGAGGEEGGLGEGEYEDLEKGAQRNLKINPAAGRDMVTDALKAPGAKAGRGFGAVSGAIPFGSAEASYSDQPFFGKWIAVVKLLFTYKYLSVLFISWFMGFGIGVIFTFLFWHLQDLGGSPTLFGVASVINHVSELFAYFLTGNLIVKYGHVRVLYAGLAGNVARFLYISFLSNPWWVLPFEFVQGLTHAAVWAACCGYITHAIPVTLRSSAQGILQGLHHGLGRGCGAVFGGLMVYSYGSVVTFRIYGVTCLLVLLAYLGVNFFLQDRGQFSHGGHQPHDMFEDTSQLAPHGVPSGMARDLSSSRLAQDDKQEYGAMSYEGTSNLPVRGGNSAPGKEQGRTSGYINPEEVNPLHYGYNQGGSADRIAKFETPRLPTLIYQQQPRNSVDQNYGP